LKIAVFELETWEYEAFASLREEHELLLTGRAVGPDLEHKYLDAGAISTFIYSDLSADSLRQFAGLKLIATRSTGYSHIDLDFCREAGISVCNVPEYAQSTVAEHTFALLLAISRHIPQAVERTRIGSFSQEGLRGFDLSGKTMGVIGAGNIGLRVIAIARGFEMNVVAFDVRPDTELAASLGFRYAGMDEVLSTADVLTLHVPGTEKTRHMISEAEFARMKQGVVLINTSRGSVIDIVALLDALATGRVAAAGLDVLPEEPAMREEAELLRSVFTSKQDFRALFAGHMLMHRPNVIVTPHTAFYTQEALTRLLATSVENISAFARGTPQNLVTA